MTVAWLIGYAGVMVGLVQKTVEFVKELFPGKLWDGMEKIWSLVASIGLCLLTPIFLRTMPPSLIADASIPPFLLEMPWQLSVVIGIVISQGSNKFNDWLGRSAGTGDGILSRKIYGTGDGTTEKTDPVPPTK